MIDCVLYVSMGVLGLLWLSLSVWRVTAMLNANGPKATREAGEACGLPCLPLFVLLAVAATLGAFAGLLSGVVVRKFSESYTAVTKE